MNPIIPFFPPDTFEADRNVIYRLVYEAGTKNQFILKKNVALFETAISEYSGAKYAVSCHSDSGAIALALRAIGIEEADEVIVQGFCCQTIAQEVINLRATPVFVDIHPDTMSIDPCRIEELISNRTRAIVPTHLFSSMLDMSAVMEIASNNALLVIEHV